jgi:hypothetical protein
MSGLVLVVVGRDLLVGDLGVLGHLLEDPLLDELRADVALHAVLAEALLLQLILVLLLAAAEVLLLDLREPVVHLLVRDLDAELVGLDLELRPLDEELDGLVLEGVVLGRAALREVALLQRVALLRLRDERVELGLRDVGAVDDRDRIGRHFVAAAAAAGDDQREQDEQRENGDLHMRHKKKRPRREPSRCVACLDHSIDETDRSGEFLVS